jgi:hypothetical protein
MSTVNYPSPVTVNGYSCKNCTDVDYAKKNIDPAHPKDGPFGVDAKARPASAPAVTFGGALAGASVTSKANGPPTARPGLMLDMSA